MAKLSGQPALNLFGDFVRDDVVVLVISGHVCVTGRRIDTGKHGNTVHQMVVDYQNQENGGNGFLRLLQFPPEGKTIRVVDYSPYLDQNSAIKNTDFEIDLPPQPRPV